MAIQPTQTKTYANVEIKQGEDYTLTLTMESPWSSSNKEFSAKIVKDFAGTSFTYNSLPVASVAFDSIAVSGTDGGTIVIKMGGVNTEKFSDSFEGYWDLLEKDTGTTTYTKQAQGEVTVDDTGSPISAMAAP